MSTRPMRPPVISPVAVLEDIDDAAAGHEEGVQIVALAERPDLPPVIRKSSMPLPCCTLPVMVPLWTSTRSTNAAKSRRCHSSCRCRHPAWSACWCRRSRSGRSGTRRCRRHKCCSGGRRQVAGGKAGRASTQQNHGGGCQPAVSEPVPGEKRAYCLLKQVRPMPSAGAIRPTGPFRAYASPCAASRWHSCRRKIKDHRIARIKSTTRCIQITL